jgi:hypothetical protein
MNFTKYFKLKYVNTLMEIKKFFIKLYEKLKQNNTIDILLVYINLILYKIIPFLIPLSLIGFSNTFINILRFIIVVYLMINLLITDFILRQSIKIRNNVITEHNCEKCSNNIVWNIQDNISNMVFFMIGGIIFKYNIYLDMYWRSYIHTLPIFIKHKLCIQKSVELQFIIIPFGILNYVCEYIISFFLPFEYNLILMFFITFLIDCIIFNLDIVYNCNNNVINILLKIVWKISQTLTIGYFEIKKRTMENKNIVDEIIKKLYYLRNNIWYRMILWKEFQSLDNFISLGNTSVFYREHILNFYDLLQNIHTYLETNTTLKIARKTKILHISTIFKPFMSNQNKFYISLFESRKSIEPFIKQIIQDLDNSITKTSCNMIYEELYNFEKKIESENVKIIEKFY